MQERNDLDHESLNDFLELGMKLKQMDVRDFVAKVENC